MDLQLGGQVVFVAGSSRGIGRGIAEMLLGEGANVVISGRDAGSLLETEAELRRLGGERVLAVQGGFTDGAAVASALAQTVERFGRIDHMVANLGTGSGKPGWEQGEAEWSRLFEANFFASVRLVEAAMPYLLKNAAGGSLLFIASITGVEATGAPLPYSAAKAALLNYAKNLARMMGPQKVRVNAIAPGNIFFEGGSWEKKASANAAGVDAMLEAEVPLARFGTPEEIASFAAYLCSPLAGFATGGCYVMDGGQTRTI